MSALVNGDRKVPWATDLAITAPLAPLKYEVAINSRTLPETTFPDRPLRYIDIGSVDSLGKISSLEELTFSSAPSRARRLPRAGDTIVSTVRTYLRAISYVETDDPSLVCSTGFAVVTAGKRLYPRYLAHWMRSDPVVDEICARSTGVSYPAINASEIGSLPVPLLTMERQREIANFLDRRTASIDALIDKKERLLQLLHEKRLALITLAVTRGLDPNVPTKESGVEWIGSVPAHWDVAPLYSRFSVQLGKMLDSSRDDGKDHRPYLRNANVQWGKIDLTDVKTMPFGAADRARYRIAPGDLLVCEGGANINVVGKSAIWRGEIDECYYQKALHRVRAQRRGEGVEFLLYALWCAFARGAFIAGANANTVFHLTAEKLRSHRFAFPPCNEQEAIVERIEHSTRATEHVVSKMEESLVKLREYRQALITAAVTGLIDVSTEAA